MRAVSWFDNTYKNKALKDSTWGEIEGFIEDKTRSGKTKRRGAYSNAKQKFNITMHFTYSEYSSFSYWYKNSLKNGVLSFLYPNIENGMSVADLAEYRISSGGAPKYSNPSGQIIECTMVWEKI